MKRIKAVKKTAFFGLMITMILTMLISPVYAEGAEENVSSEVFAFDYSQTYDDPLYAEWYAYKWDYVTANTEEGFVSSKTLMMKRGNYQDYDLSFDFTYKRGDVAYKSKAYFASRFMLDGLLGDADGFMYNDLGEDSEDARPGTTGVLLGMAGNAVEIIVHTVDATSPSGYSNIKAIFSLPYGNFKSGVKVGVKDTGDAIEYAVAGQKIASVTFKTLDNGNIHADIVGADGNVVAQTDNAHVTSVGTLALLSRNGDFELRAISMTALSGDATKSVVREALFDHDDILLQPKSSAETKAEDTTTQAPVEAETTVNTEGVTQGDTASTIDQEQENEKNGVLFDTTEICVIIMFNVICLGVAAGMFIVSDRYKAVLAVLAVSFVVAQTGNVLMGTGVIDIHKQGSAEVESGVTLVTEQVTDAEEATQADISVKEEATQAHHTAEATAVHPLIDVNDLYVLDDKGNTPQVTVTNANQRAQDAIGRDLPTYEEVGDTKEGKYVGIFYTLWTTSATRELNDATRILAQYPEGYEGGPEAHMGSAHEFHWWSEPEVGYADSSDKWYIRRNMYYLNMAGIDYIYLDFTNSYIYEEAFDVLLETCLEMRAEGLQTPSIVPWCFGDDSGSYRDIGYLYRTYFSQEKYRSLWFYMDGKPLVCLKVVQDTVAQYTAPLYLPVFWNEDICDFFTIRFAWVPSENDDGHYPGQRLHKWSWNTPMFLYTPSGKSYNLGWDEKRSAAEQMCIGVGGYCNIDSGRSGTEGTLDRFREKETSGLGLYIEQQFTFMMENHPETEYLNIQGWNEWIAQYFPEHLTTGATSFGFVDQYNREFGRDMEPTKGGYSDNYFYQLCSLVRRFKGMDAPEEQSNQTTIDMSAGFDQWQSLTGTYDDYYNDTTWRDDYDPTGKIHYVNETGRNDIVHSKVAYDAGNIYFYVETAKAMTPYTDHNWMLLFIDADDDPDTGWEGYDYLINYEVLSEDQTVICQYIDNIWQEIGVISYAQSGNQMQIAIPRSLIGETSENISLGFHWNDNVSNVYDLECWFLEGDNAPERRNMYIFSAKAAYDATAEIRSSQRAEADRLQYMKASDKTTDGLKAGLMAEKYVIADDYGKQPEIWLLMNAYGTEGNRIWSGVKDTVALISEEPRTAFAISYDGYILIPEDAEVTFTLNSDDGTVLYINDRQIIDNSGVHGAKSATATIKLEAGLHKFRLEYFENGNGNSTLAFGCDAEGYQFYCEN